MRGVGAVRPRKVQYTITHHSQRMGNSGSRPCETARPRQVLGMSKPTRPEPDPDPPADIGYEHRIRQFEMDWLAGRRPDLDEYLAGFDVLSHSLLVELVHIDMEFRIKSGMP